MLEDQKVSMQTPPPLDFLSQRRTWYLLENESSASAMDALNLSRSISMLFEWQWYDIESSTAGFAADCALKYRQFQYFHRSRSGRFDTFEPMGA